jgi:branched-chain amino acid transport system ATP-binding protein
MLKIERINVYRGDVHVLWDLSLDVSAGEIVTLIGPNGAGKSTLLRAVVSLLKPTHGDREPGRIFFQGRDLTRLSPEDTVRLGMAIVPEGSRVFPDMTVQDNLLMGSYVEPARLQRKKSLQEVFELFPKLGNRLLQKARTLSGGERQMLAIGRALMSRPTLLLLDEPSLGLQPLLVGKVFETVKEINRRGMTILLVEQNVQFSLEISHRAYVLENGRIAFQGKASELLENERIKKFYLAL